MFREKKLIIYLALLIFLLPINIFASDSSYNVIDYDAYPNGVEDSTAAFQKVMDEAGIKGGIVSIPAGRYRFDSTLNIPANVTLQGVYQYAPASSGIRDKRPDQLPEFGTVLEPYAGADNEDGTPFITLNGNSTLKGVTIHYREQDPQAAEPTPYPFSIAMRGNNPAVIDVQLLNPYKGIDASKNQRALIRNVHGQPIALGILVDGIYDIGRIENVHWNPWWSINTPVYEWQLKHGIGFLFQRTDWHYVLNTFCFGYSVGYKFSKSKSGSCNGNFLGIGADACGIALLAEETAPMGILITNGEFVSFPGDDPTMIKVTDTHTGTLRISNSAFWGPCNRNAVINGSGTVGFSDCTFMQWGNNKGTAEPPEKGFPSIDAYSGSLIIRGCEFLDAKPQITIHEDVDRAVITGNLINGPKHITVDKHAGNIIIENNAATPTGKTWERKLHKTKGFREGARRTADADERTKKKSTK